MKRIAWLAMMAALVPLSGAAQSDDGPEWELQRCIWRCLANSPGAESREYEQCVSAFCSEGPAAAPAVQAVPSGAWFASGTGDGQGNLAGISDPRTGAAFYLICGPDGRRNLALFGPEGPEATLTLQVDGQAFARTFVPHAGGYYAALPADAPEIAALRSGRAMALRNAAGGTLFEAGLTGAGAAIAAACG